MIPDDIKTDLSEGTVPQDAMRNEPGTNYVSILLLRELDSHAVFTTNGEDADIATVVVEVEGEPLAYSPGLMFKRKQTGSDRREGKAMMRDLLGEEDTMQVNTMNPKTVESALYGSAASESEDGIDASVTSRVMYDTAYTLRDAATVIDEKFQNAPGDDYVKGAESTIREPDFFEPGTMFPSVITLRDATPAEVAFVLAITRRNKRYGAATTRLGRVTNHVLDIYVGGEEGPSNLDVTRGVIRRFAGADRFDSAAEVVRADALPHSQTKEHAREAFKTTIDERHVDHDRVGEEVRDRLLELTTEDNLVPILEEQSEASAAFIENAVEN